MKYCKIYNVKDPERAGENEAGIDFYIPSFDDEKFIKELKSKNPVIHLDKKNKRITLCPQESIIVPSGIKVNIPHGYALMAKNRSGNGSKLKLTKMAQLIDETYMNEIYMNVLNAGTERICLVEGMKLLQFALVPVSYEPMEFCETEEEVFENYSSERGLDGFGSTDKKIYDFVECNDWEGETWHRYILMTEEQYNQLNSTEWLTDNESPFSINETDYTVDNIEEMVEVHNESSTCSYMQGYEYIGELFKIPEYEEDYDPFYKGQIEDFCLFNIEE